MDGDAVRDPTLGPEEVAVIAESAKRAHSEQRKRNRNEIVADREEARHRSSLHSKARPCSSHWSAENSPRWRRFALWASRLWTL